MSEQTFASLDTNNDQVISNTELVYYKLNLVDGDTLTYDQAKNLTNTFGTGAMDNKHLTNEHYQTVRDTLDSWYAAFGESDPAQTGKITVADALSGTRKALTAVDVPDFMNEAAAAYTTANSNLQKTVRLTDYITYAISMHRLGAIYAVARQDSSKDIDRQTAKDLMIMTNTKGMVKHYIDTLFGV